MKNFFAPILVILSFSAVAQRPRGELRVRMTDGNPISVVINGRDYERRASSITIGDLPRGKHRIQVYAMRGKRLQNPELVYSGRVRVEESAVTYVSVDPTRHAARVQTRAVGDIVPWGNASDDANDRSRPYDDNGANATSGRSTRNSNMPWLTDADLEDLRRRATERTTDGSKLELIRNVIAGRRYSTAQVRAMAGMLTFESTKLDLAKQAYEGVSDPKDYWKLEDIFTFDASKKELQDYMAQRR